MRIETHGLVVGYGDQPVCAIADAVFTADRVNVVTGPNGAGKTTLLRTLAGLLPPVGGGITPCPRPGPGGSTYVASSPWLFAGTVDHNMKLVGVSGVEVARALNAMGVDHLSSTRSDRLSTGQLQRVAIARAIALEPDVLLVDEPERGLDAEGVNLWRLCLHRALDRRSPLVIVASHDRPSLGDVPIQEIHLVRTESSAKVSSV